MGIWGKIVGGMAGFALGGPLGAVIGAAAGHLYDKKKGPGDGPASEAIDRRQIAFTTAVIVLAAKMAKADGVVSRDEIQAFREVFHVPPEDEKVIGAVFNEAKRDATGYEPYAAQIADLFGHEPEVMENLLGALCHIAKADGEVHPKELEILARTAQIFGFSASEFERIKAVHLPQRDKAEDPYQILGAEASWSEAELKSHYRKLIRENHPDALMAKGLPQEFVDLANEKMAKINAAYDRIQKDRGFS